MNDQASVPDANFEHARQLIPAAQTVPAIHDPYGRLAGTAQACLMNRSHSVSRSCLNIGAFCTSANGSSSVSSAAFMALSAVRTLMQVPTYTSTVRLQIDRNTSKVVEGGELMHLSKIIHSTKPSTSFFRAARWRIVWPLSSS